MRIHSLRATTTPSGLSLFAAIYNGNNNNSNQQKYMRTVPSSISRPPRGLCIRCGVRFRPCIDIHEGKVKQIVGSTIQDLKEGSPIPVTNFESDKSAIEYANIYKEDGLTGGHVIMIGADPLSKSAAMEALHAYPGGFQVGGGINPDNALSYIEEGASHVIITSECTLGQEIACLKEKLSKDLSIITGKYQSLEKDLNTNAHLLELSKERYDILEMEFHLLKEERDSLLKTVSSSSKSLERVSEEKDRVWQDLNSEVQRRKNLEEEIKQFGIAFAWRQKSLMSFQSEFKSKFEKLKAQNPVSLPKSLGY